MNTLVKSIEMARGNGYGQYKIVVEFSFEGESYKKSFHTTDSELWDDDAKTSEMLLDHIGGEQRLLETI
jgi:protein-disulfide isomerase